MLELSVGAAGEACTAYGGEFIFGPTMDLSFALDIPVSEKWSLKPSLGHSILLGNTIGIMLQDSMGDSGEGYGFANVALMGQYHTSSGIILGAGPSFNITTINSTYESLEAPNNPKIKPFDYGVRALAAKDFGEKWRLGVQTNIGLRNMLIQYPEQGISGSCHFYTLSILAARLF